MTETVRPEIPGGAFRIDREGTWRHEGQEVTHPGVLRNLYANLRREGDHYFLAVGPRRIPVEVADVPFVVTRVEIETGPPGVPARLRGHLSDGTSEELDPEVVWLDRAGVPYARVKGRTFTARLSLAAWLQLADLIEEGPAGEVVLVVGTRRLALPRGPGDA